ncbi:hypothetical protein [Dyella acidiphila]|uniref:Uncharacterized protein n=1 Tax=Dyella acidiphila TaxID=2775866 RepID=A0ABR9G652_9GAMM|nr:hypothetical protein [Dyella acidiphila]MBE1159525.1 hypothetical protein [Dyella acidiphila]
MRTHARFIRKTALASLVALCAASTAFAQTAAPATGLGQAWPDAADLSASPNWHVYVFVLNGVKYIQVNDLNGTVHAAVGTVNGTAFALPVGVDSSNVATNSSSSSTSTTTQTVYNDGTTAVTATPQSDGTTQFSASNVQADLCEGKNCSGTGGS